MKTDRAGRSCNRAATQPMCLRAIFRETLLTEAWLRRGSDAKRVPVDAPAVPASGVPVSASCFFLGRRCTSRSWVSSWVCLCPGFAFVPPINAAAMQPMWTWTLEWAAAPQQHSRHTAHGHPVCPACKSGEATTKSRSVRSKWVESDAQSRQLSASKEDGKFSSDVFWQKVYCPGYCLNINKLWSSSIHKKTSCLSNSVFMLISMLFLSMLMMLKHWLEWDFPFNMLSRVYSSASIMFTKLLWNTRGMCSVTWEQGGRRVRFKKKNLNVSWIAVILTALIIIVVSTQRWWDARSHSSCHLVNSDLSTYSMLTTTRLINSAPLWYKVATYIRCT